MSEELQAVFLEELGDLIESLESGLLGLRDNPSDHSLIDEVFRSLHTIKGSGAMFGFTDLSGFVHTFETAFDTFRKGTAQLTPEIIGICLAARDLIPNLLEPDAAANAEGQRILAQLAAETGVAVASAGHAPAAAAVSASVANAGGRTEFGFRLKDNAILLGSRPDLILNELRDLGADDIIAHTDRMPPLAQFDPAVCYVHWTMTLPAHVDRQQVEDVFAFHDAELDFPEAAPVVAAVAVDAPVSAVAAARPRGDEPAERGAASTEATTVRVGTGKLDTLMDQVGELVIAEARLTELARQSGDPALMGLSEQITRLSTGLRTSTMSIRMVPFKMLVSRFRRLVGDLSVKLGKHVDFVVTGEDTELDKTMIEKLVDPLVHILRNSMDHGIEQPDRREAGGKPRTGKIELIAEHSGSEVLVIIRDDGKGLDSAAIRAKAIERGLLAVDQQISEEKLNALIFEPAFSTNSEVSELSGRGVGMDVVKRTIDSMRGRIEVDTAPGVGTTIVLRMPLTLAIVEGMLIEVDGEKYTLPLAAVKEIVDLPSDKAVGDNSTDFLDVRGEYVPFLRLRTLLGCPALSTLPQVMIVVGAGGGSVGIVVDRIIGTSQTVIKQMSPLHEGIRTISGATILGDGSIALILDALHLVELGKDLAGDGNERAVA